MQSVTLKGSITFQTDYKNGKRKLREQSKRGHHDYNSEATYLQKANSKHASHHGAPQMLAEVLKTDLFVPLVCFPLDSFNTTSDSRP